MMMIFILPIMPFQDLPDAEPLDGSVGVRIRGGRGGRGSLEALEIVDRPEPARNRRNRGSLGFALGRN